MSGKRELFRHIVQLCSKCFRILVSGYRPTLIATAIASNNTASSYAHGDISNSTTNNIYVIFTKLEPSAVNYANVLRAVVSVCVRVWSDLSFGHYGHCGQAHVSPPTSGQSLNWPLSTTDARKFVTVLMTVAIATDAAILTTLTLWMTLMTLPTTFTAFRRLRRLLNISFWWSNNSNMM